MPRINTSKTSKQREGERLKELRQAMDMTVRDLAKEFKVSFSAISQWETGNRTIPGPVLKLIEIYEEKLRKGKSPH